jgi:hypothetical protein
MLSTAQELLYTGACRFVSVLGRMQQCPYGTCMIGAAGYDDKHGLTPPQLLHYPLRAVVLCCVVC